MGLLRRRARGAGEAVSDATDQAVAAVRKPLTAKQAKRMVGVGKAVVPLLAPYALAAAGVARAGWEARKAAKLGVDPGQLSAYAGRGGALHARISRVAETLSELEGPTDQPAGAAPRALAAAPGSGDAAAEFTARTRPRLADLAVAVRAAEQMPTARRRAAFTAVGHELDRIEDELLERLGLRDR